MEGNQPGYVKDNPITRAMDFGRQLNIERGAPIARSVGDAPTVKVIPASMAAPLTEEEVRTRDNAAKALGILPGDGPDELLDKMQREHPLPYEIGQGISAPSPAPPTRSRLIDFKKIQGIDLIRGLVYVDGFEIKIPDEDVKDFKKYALELAVDFVTKQLASAMAELEPPKEETDGVSVSTEGETLPEMPGDPATD